MSKKPPELTWQDKAILITIPLVVLAVFVMANYFSKDLTVGEAFQQELPDAIVRDDGQITQLLDPGTATATQQCRFMPRSGSHECTLVFNITGSDTLALAVGRNVKFFGRYTFDDKGGKVEAPYREKSGRMAGWVVYGSKRFHDQSTPEPTGLD